MTELVMEYTHFKRGIWKDPEHVFENVESFKKYIRIKALDISSNERELASYAVLSTYAGVKGKIEFPWVIFPDGLLENILANSRGGVMFPVKDPAGNINYLFENYSIRNFDREIANENDQTI